MGSQKKLKPLNLLGFTAPLRSSRGLGIIEVVIASAILGVILLAISSILVTGQQGAQSVSKRLDAGQLGSFINAILVNPPVCSSSGLVGSAAPPLKDPSTPDTVSVPTLHFAGLSFDDGANSSFDNGQIKISSLKYHSVTQVSPSVYNAVIRLQVNVQNGTGQTPGGSLLAPVDFPAVYTVNGGGNIISCGTSGSPTLDQYFSFQIATTVHDQTNYTGTQNLPTPYADANYYLICSMGAANNGQNYGVFYVSWQGPSNFGWRYFQERGNFQAPIITMSCVAHHS